MQAISRIHATSISTPAAALIARNNLSGKVHSVFSRVVNIQTDHALLTVADESLLNLPLGLLCNLAELDNPLVRFSAGEPVEVVDNQLLFSLSGVIVDCNDCPPWAPYLRLSVRPKHYADVRARMNDVRRIVFSNEDVRIRLAPLLAVVHEPYSAEFDIEDAAYTNFQQRAREGLTLIIDGSRQDSVNQMIAGGLRLVGLGPGLTPSGDDVLAGLLTTLAVASSDPLRDHTLAVASHIATRAQRYTTDISASFLCFASQGYVTERFKNLLLSVVEGGPRLESNTRAMIAFGATSGVETVIGMLLGLEMLLEGLD